MHLKLVQISYIFIFTYITACNLTSKPKPSLESIDASTKNLQVDSETESDSSTADSDIVTNVDTNIDTDTNTENLMEPQFLSEIKPVPSDVAEKMMAISWHKGCPVSLDQLVYIQLSYWDFDGNIQQGSLIVNVDVSKEVVKIFKDIFDAHFKIEKMKLINEYKGNDDLSMEDNNTSAFNCRWVSGREGVYSKHSFGRAIDINPMYNPYVTKKKISPPGSECFVDRIPNSKGVIVKDGPVYKAFISQDWKWGGNWKKIKDYHHFQKKK